MVVKKLILAASMLACALAAQAAPKVPLSAFAHDDQFTNPRLSPDGKHIAVTVQLPSGDRTVPVVAFYSLPELKQVGAVRMPVFQIPLNYRWVSNSRLVIAKGLELGSREKPVSTGEVLATNLDGSNQEYLFGRDMFKSSKRGDRYGDDHAWGRIEALPAPLNNHFYLASRSWTGSHSMLYDIDTSGAARKLVADLPAPGLDFVLRNDGVPAFASGVGEDSFAVLYRYDDKAADWKLVTEKRGRRFGPQYFRPDDKSFVVLSSPKGGPDELIEEDVQTGARKLLFADQDASAGSLEPGSKHGTPLGVATTAGIPHVHYFDANSDDAKLHKSLAASFPDSVVHFIDFTDDGNTLLFKVSSDRDPGSYYLFNKAAGKAELLFTSMSEIEPADMRPRTPITFTTRDNVILHGFLTMPEHAPGVKPPLVLLPHGGPHGTYDSWYFNTDAQFLASRGYAVLQVNFRGSGGRGVNFEHAGYHQWGAKIIDDLTDGLKWTIAQGEVDGKRVCAYGAGFGGYASLMMAAREPELLKCAVGYAGIYDLNLIVNGDNARMDKTIAAFVRRYMGNDKAELDRFSPVTMAASIKAPVLLVHGGKDKTAPVEHAEAMRDALVKANHPPEWLLAPNEGHGFYDTANTLKFHQTLEAFLDKNIGH
jgi:dipeptidyl aminopeptidase/acylaminoacyl peptidase